MVGREDPREESQQGVGASKEGLQKAPKASEEELEESMNSEQRKKSLLIYLVVTMAFVSYLGWSIERINRQKMLASEDALSSAIRLFPQNPIEYNLRQRQGWIDESFRRFNIRNIGIFSGCIVATTALMVWHRRRQVQIARRKSNFFWAFTVGASFFAMAWGLFVMKKAANATVLNTISRSPSARAALYIGAMLIIGSLFFIGDLYRRRRSKRMKRMMKQQAVLGKAHFAAKLKRKEEIEKQKTVMAH